MQVLINSNSKINIKTLEYALKLSLKVFKTNIEVQKIDNSNLKIFKIVLANF